MTIRPKLGVALILKFIIKSQPYISYTIFIEVLLLYLLRYIHGYMKSWPYLAGFVIFAEIVEPGFSNLPCKILIGGIYLMSTEFLL